MILKFLKIFAYIYKNRLLTDTLLENNKDFNILFIQESLWSIIPSFISEEKKEIISILNHLLWIIFSRTSNTKNEHLRVLTYIILDWLGYVLLISIQMTNNQP